MTKGKRSQIVNARLRENLAQAEEARRRLEHRVIEAERERDAALAEVERVRRDGHPAVIEAQEAASARVRHIEKQLEAERQRWADFAEATKKPVLYMIKNLKTDAPFLSYDFLEWAAEMWGEGVGASFQESVNPGSSTRVHRRNTKDKAKARRAIRLSTEVHRQES